MFEMTSKDMWKKYIDKKVYRIMPSDQKSNVLKKGFDPKKDPYEKINPKIKKMFKIVKRLEKEGVVFRDEWANSPVKGSTVVKVSMRSVKGKYIDFVANKKQLKKFEKSWVGGGCLVTYVLKLTDFLLENIDKLSSSEKELIKYLNKWANKRKNKKRFVIYIKGSNKIFESAKFYCFTPEFKKYWKSPFGSFKHFEKIMKKGGFKKYMPFLKGEKLFYLRVPKKIPSDEIKLLK